MNGFNSESLQLFLGKIRCRKRMTCYSWSLLLLCIYLCQKRTWYKTPPGSHEAAARSPSPLLPYEVLLLQVCSYSHQQVKPACAPTAVHAIPWEDTSVLPLGLYARKATMKQREQGTRTPLETWRTRSKQLKHHHPYCMQRQGLSVNFFSVFKVPYQRQLLLLCQNRLKINTIIQAPWAAGD